jgi:hypothetical protein
MPRFAIVIAWALMVCSSGGCAARGIEDIELALRADETLWVPDGAAIEPDNHFHPVATVYGRSVFIDGSAHVTFTRRGEREVLTTEVVNHFAGSEWRERERQYLNPQTPTSFKSGWRHVCGCIVMVDVNGKPIPRDPYYDWVGEWENPRGDVVRYMMSAEGPQLRAYASFIPKRIVQSAPR